ncbi:polysaccharide deacetylase family protein [Parafrankia sp. EAN1pec]|uniref:polysaccharide deacetylase family protein n=1 Tax=Parafrankia sp. (strain EAN1pec) TaxID=298653 RepID=UPI0000541AC0
MTPPLRWLPRRRTSCPDGTGRGVRRGIRRGGRAATTAGLLAVVLGAGAGAAAPVDAAPDAPKHPPRHARAATPQVLPAEGRFASPPAPPAPPRTPPPRRAARPVPGTNQRPPAAPDGATGPGAASAPSGQATGTGTLILYDTTGAWGWLGEQYAMQAANLASRFGTWQARPVSSYTAGQMSAYAAVVYVGSTYDEQVPTAFLTDVLAGNRPVVWMYNNIWQLTSQAPTFPTTYGWNWSGFDTSAIGTVSYKGTDLTRYTANAAGIMNYASVDTTRATVLAEAVRGDGTRFPWALRSGNLTYIGEIPFAYADMTDRYLAVADMLFDVLAPQTAARHRGLVRIEDVGPDADPAELHAIADYLSSAQVPFSVAVYPRYVDANGTYNNGVPQDYTLASKPAVVSALKYMTQRGGTLIMHGWTHQFSNVANPYSGASADDFEFFRAHVDAQDYVVYDGPVPGDSQAWATDRMNGSAAAFTAAGLPVPTTFEFPHYAASAPDYAAARAKFPRRYDRGLYFRNQLAGGAVDHTKYGGQFFPYPVTDVHGSFVIPENIGNIEPEPFNNHLARLPAELIDAARRNLVVRDGFASMFYHPYLGVDYLRQTVEGVRALGYTFVAAGSVVAGG